MIGKSLTCFVSVLAGLAAASTAQAGAITFTGTQDNLSAAAKFEVDGSNLVITLSNIGGDVLVPADVLTTVFFDIDGSPTLTPISAVLAPGSSAVFDPDGQPAGGVVGGEWDYRGDVSIDAQAIGAGITNQYGIGSSGLDIFGDPEFPGVNLAGPDGVDGMQYGLLSQIDNLATGNPAVTGGNSFVKYSVVFTLSGIPMGFDPMLSVKDVVFQYGTGLNEPRFKGVPEPATLALLTLGALPMVSRRRR